MNYSLNAGEWNSVFAVPSSVVDKYIKLASGDSLKLLLFLLRNGGRLFSDAELKERLGFRREGELQDAALFWVQRGILRAEGGSLSAASDDIPVQETLPEIPELPEKKPRTSGVKVISGDASVYTAGYTADRIKSDPQLSWLYSQAENMYGRGLRQPESQTIVRLVEHFGLPAQVAAMLLQYCFRIGKTSANYIESVAQTWADDNVTTVADADERLARLEKRFSVEEELRAAMEMKTKFSANQLNFIRKWNEEYGFSVDMILLAHETTLDKIGKMSFSYTNKILESWHGSGIHTKEAVRQEAENFKASAKAKTAPSNSSINMDDVMDSIWKKYST